MKRRVGVIAAFGIVLIFNGSGVFAQAKRPNALAELLVGEWEPAPKVQEIIGKCLLAKEQRHLSFRKADDAWGKVPEGVNEKWKGFVKEKKLEVRLTGWMTVRPMGKGAKEHPFHIAELNGNPMFFFAQDSNTEGPFGRIGDGSLFVVNGETSDRDILFMGPRPGEVHAAYKRVMKK